MKDANILEQLELLKSNLEKANVVLNDLYERNMFIVISFDERSRTMSPVLQVKTAIHHVDYLKE
jgi:hypothetical protein